MKEGWTYKKLGDICEVISGQSPEGKYYNNEGKGTPFYQGKKDFTLKYIGAPTMWTTEVTKLAEKDDLLMSVRAPVGDVNFATQRICIGRGLAAIRNKNEVDKDYLFYFLLAKKSEIKGKDGVGFASINRKEIMDIGICFPISFSEQQRIVERLDSAFAHIDALKANAEKQLSEARALFQKALAKAMEPKDGWEEKKIKEICETVTDFVAAGSFASLRENVVYKNEKDYAQLVRTTDLKSGFSKGGFVYVDEHAFNYLYRVNLDKECIILPNVGVNCGEVYYVSPSMLPYNNNVLGPNAILVRSKIYNNHFLSYLFLGKDFQKQLSDITSHMAQPKFNKTSLKEILIKFPPLSDQQRIVEHLDLLSAHVKMLEENQRKVIAECDALKQAMLRQVFE